MTPEEVDALPESGGFDYLTVPVDNGVARWTSSDGVAHEKKFVCGDTLRVAEARPAVCLALTELLASDSQGKMWNIGEAGGVTYKMRAGA